ncbi:calcium-dependent protein [Salix suchowensis]|nr:calcium-dependent protein [Salix suchowensis]
MRCTSLTPDQTNCRLEFCLVQIQPRTTSWINRLDRLVLLTVFILGWVETGTQLSQPVNGCFWTRIRYTVSLRGQKSSGEPYFVSFPEFSDNLTSHQTHPALTKRDEMAKAILEYLTRPHNQLLSAGYAKTTPEFINCSTHTAIATILHDLQLHLRDFLFDTEGTDSKLDAIHKEVSLGKLPALSDTFVPVNRGIGEMTQKIEIRQEGFNGSKLSSIHSRRNHTIGLGELDQFIIIVTDSPGIMHSHPYRPITWIFTCVLEPRGVHMQLVP